MSKLPDWVLKHKVKGTNIICKNGNYYLYKVHSERRPDKKYPVLITDEYIGVINEEGLIPKKQKVEDIIVREFGLTQYFLNLTLSIYPNIDEKKFVIIVLTLAYGKATYINFKTSFISELYPESFSLSESNIQKEVNVILKQVDQNLNFDLLKQVYKVKISNTWFNANIDDNTRKELDKYSIILE